MGIDSKKDFFQIRSISDLEKLSYQVKWQYFEKLVAFIFSENGYDARQNIVLKLEGKKRQFDVIAEGYGKIFLVECKKWRSRKESVSSIKSAASRHIERCILYSKAMKKEVIPLIVTLNDEQMETEDMHVVSVMKLNSFLSDFDLL